MTVYICVYTAVYMIVIIVCDKTGVGIAGVSRAVFRCFSRLGVRRLNVRHAGGVGHVWDVRCVRTRRADICRVRIIG